MIFNKTSLALAVSLSISVLSGCSDDDKKVAASEPMQFNRVATFFTCEQISPVCNTDETTVAEIVAASKDGNTLIYTDSPQNKIGFVDIRVASQPKKGGTLVMGGEPTSVAVLGNYAVVGVNTSADYVNRSGDLVVVDIATKTIVRRIALGGQPDSVAVSPSGKYIAVAIENERDEDLNDGLLPQFPAGYLSIIDVAEKVENWSVRKVELTGLDGLQYASDPEPEYVAINSDDVAVLTLQENNHIALINLKNGAIQKSVSAGAVDLVAINATTNKPGKIALTESLDAIPREPDGVAWLGNDYFATANEGDLVGGSRGFSIFSKAGELVWDSGNLLEQLAVRFGHYPEKRAGKKGVEPENITYGIFNNTPYLFVNAERANLIFMFDVSNPVQPKFKQILPASAGPEGSTVIPDRNLLVVASEVDDREVNLRGAVNIYYMDENSAAYPTIESVDNGDGAPISWSAMSGLSASKSENILYAIEDSFYASNRIFTLDTSTAPAKLTAATAIKDSNGVFAGLMLPDLVKTDNLRASTFDKLDLAALINSDKTVNIDPEGIALASDGGFWVASEGNGTQGEADRPILSENLIFKTNADGVIEQVIRLPEAINAKQIRFGFEGVAEDAGKLYVVFQRAWIDDKNPRVGIYDLTEKTWQFVFYSLDAVASQAKGWVGLSDLTALGNGEFLVIERDNKAGFDAAIKRLYKINLASVTNEQVITKTLVRDLLDDLKLPAGMVPEKIEGLAVTPSGKVFIVNDNDGIDDNSGETQLLNLGKVLN
ncbi:MAG: esterase-like activity of phytase family protein [Marinagarivorans sp.]|nr:esterase-like activity of phytase family protein [Marinagarivorans sp.]